MPESPLAERERQRDVRGSAVRARLIEGESRYWEQSASSLSSSFSLYYASLALPLSGSISLKRALSRSPVYFPFSLARIVSSFSLSLSFSLSFYLVSRRSYKNSLSLSVVPAADALAVESCRRSPSFPLRFSLSSSASSLNRFTLGSRSRGAGAKRTKPKLKLTATASAGSSSSSSSCSSLLLGDVSLPTLFSFLSSDVKVVPLISSIPIPILLFVTFLPRSVAFPS